MVFYLLQNQQQTSASLIPVSLDENTEDERVNFQNQIDHNSQLPSENQKQTKFLLNVETEKTSQPLQLLFQLPTVHTTSNIQPSSEAIAPQKKSVQQTQMVHSLTAGQIYNQTTQSMHVSQQNQQTIQFLPPSLVEMPSPVQQQRNQHQVATQTQQPIDSAYEIQSAALTRQTLHENNSKATKLLMKKTEKRLKEKRFQPRSHPTGQTGFQYDQTGIPLPPFPINQVINSGRTIDVDSETDSNHDTALTLACAGGHEELVELLLARGANIEHRDKKGFTPLILAATAGHAKVVEILVREKADLEAQSERTKDTPLSLACSGGRYEVVELLLKHSANKEHRNVSDYTPLSLAASGGYVSIIKLLLNQGAEINSRTGSKLGISPLMLAAMNGHTPAVRLLLDMGSDINAQIETNRNTALTLACFQGRHEVVSLLLDRKANVEHRAKTGLTPLMEAASGGYIEVGRVLLDKGADVNSAPVPSSRDTALTIAADKGHLRFVELLLARNASVEVKNKKGNSPLWLAANGGHLGVVEILFNAGADIDSQDNRKVSCLMAAFRKGHTKIVKWMVNHVTQFPSDQEMTRFISTISDRDISDKCNECVKIIRVAKETQARKAYMNASILLRELDMEKTKEEQRKAAAAKRRERKKRRKQEKRQMQQKTDSNKTVATGLHNIDKSDHDESEEESDGDVSDGDLEENENIVSELPKRVPTDHLHQPELRQEKEEGDSGIDANSQGSCSSAEVKSQTKNEMKHQIKKRNKQQQKPLTDNKDEILANNKNFEIEVVNEIKANKKNSSDNFDKPEVIQTNKRESTKSIEKGNLTLKLGTKQSGSRSKPEGALVSHVDLLKISHDYATGKAKVMNTAPKHASEQDEFDTLENANLNIVKFKQHSTKGHAAEILGSNKSNLTFAFKREEGWKEVIRKSSVQQSLPIDLKKVQVPTNAISRVIGRGGSNINAIRSVTGAHIEVEKQGKIQSDRSITIKGSLEATKQAHHLITTLIKDSDADIFQILAREGISKSPTFSLTNNQMNIGIWEKSKASGVSSSCDGETPIIIKKINTSATAKANIPIKTNPIQRTTEPRILTSNIAGNTQAVLPEKRLNFSNSMRPVNIRSSATNSSNINTITKTQPKVISQTFASRVSAIVNDDMKNKVEKGFGKMLEAVSLTTDELKRSSTNSSKQCFTENDKIASNNSKILPRLPNNSMYDGNLQPTGENLSLNKNYKSSFDVQENELISSDVDKSSMITSQLQSNIKSNLQGNAQAHEYSLFNDSYGGQWDNKQYKNSTTNKVFLEQESFIYVDESKAPGYRGHPVNSPVNSKTSSQSTTPPSNVASQNQTALAMNSSGNYNLHCSEVPTITQTTKNLSRNTSVAELEVITSSNSHLKLSTGVNLTNQFTNIPTSQYQILPVSESYATPHIAPNIPIVHDVSCNAFEQYSNSPNLYGADDPQYQPSGNVSSFNSRLNPKATSFPYLHLQNTSQNPNYHIDSSSSIGPFVPSAYVGNNFNNFQKISQNPAMFTQNHHGVNTSQIRNSDIRWYQSLGFTGRDPMHIDSTTASVIISPTSSPTLASNVSIPGNFDDSRKIPRPIGMERNWKYTNHYSSVLSNQTTVGLLENENANMHATWQTEAIKSSNQLPMPWNSSPANLRGHLDEITPGAEQFQVKYTLYLQCFPYLTAHA